MWKSSCCIFFALILAIIGLSIDLLMWQQNTNTERFEIQAIWGYDTVQITAIVDVRDYHNDDYEINYFDLYNRECQDPNSQPGYCNTLNKIAKAGQVYISFGLFGVLLLSLSFILSVCVSFGKNCCCKCRVRIFVGFLVLVSSICFLISFVTFINSFSNNVDDLLNRIMVDAKLVDKISWEEGEIGSSIALVISAMCFSFLSLSVILFIDRKSDNMNNNNNNSRYPSEPLIAQQPVSSGIVYYQPNHDVSNSTNNTHYGEPDYQTPV